MATYYATEFVGQKDGTANPPKRLDGRVVGAKERRIRARKPAGQALASADLLFVGTLPGGASLKSFAVNSDTSFGSATISLGTLTNPTKYISTKTMTATDVLTTIGPKASAMQIDPNDADEDLYVTVGSATIAGAVVATFEAVYTVSA